MICSTLKGFPAKSTGSTQLQLTESSCINYNVKGKFENLTFSLTEPEAEAEAEAEDAPPIVC